MSNFSKADAEAMQDRVNRSRFGKLPPASNVERVCEPKRSKSPPKRPDRKTTTSIAANSERASGAARAQPKQRNQALGRLPKGVMNKTEAAYARHLEALKFAGEVLDYWFEEIKFKIGTSACWYEPDFLVQVKGGAMEIHECKGHWEDDALVKTKSLALRYPFRVIAVRLIKGAWEIREFN